MEKITWKIKKRKDRRETEICAHKKPWFTLIEEMEYLEFLKSKIEIAKDSGFEVDADSINPALLR